MAKTVYTGKDGLCFANLFYHLVKKKHTNILYTEIEGIWKILPVHFAAVRTWNVPPPPQKMICCTLISFLEDRPMKSAMLEKGFA